MPKIPDYPVGSVRNAPLPGVRFSANATGESFGGAQAENLGRLAHGGTQLGDTLNQIGVHEQNEENHARVRTALSDYETNARDYLTKNVFNLEGKPALDAIPGAIEKVKAMSDEHAATLQNAAQRDIFSLHAHDVYNEFQQRVTSFGEVKRKQFQDASMADENQTALETALTFPNDSSALAKAEFTIRQNAKSQAARLGLDSTVAGTRAVSHLYEQVAAGKAVNDPVGTLTWLDENRTKFDPVTFKQIRGQLQNASKAAIVQNATEQARAGGLTEEQAHEQFVKALPADAVPTADGVYRNIQLQKQRAQKEQLSKMEDDAYAAQGKNPTAPPPAWMTDSRQINDYLANGQKLIHGVSQQEQTLTYGKLISMAASNPMAFRDEPLSKYAASLSAADYNHLRSVQADLKKGGSEETENFKRGITYAKGQMQQMPYFDTSAKAGAKALRNERRQQDFLTTFSRHLRGLPDDQRGDNKRVNEIVDQLMTDVVLKKGTWAIGDGKPFFDVEGKQFEKEALSGSTSVESTKADPSWYRSDGTKKGNGFLGLLQRTDGKVSTELSVGVQIDGKETEIPTLVPTLSKDEVEHLLEGGKPTPEIMQKAVDHAKERMAQGKSPFADNSESPKPTAAKSFDAGLDAQLGAHVGLIQSPTITGADVADSLRATGSVLNEINPVYLSYKGGKAALGVTRAIGKKLLGAPARAIGEDIAHAFPDDAEMNSAKSLHLALVKAGVDTTSADDVYKKMNHQPVNDSLDGPNTPRGYISAVNDLADKHADSLAGYFNTVRARANEVKADYQAGKISESEARSRLAQMGLYK